MTVTDLLEIPSTRDSALKLGDRLAELMYKNGGSLDVTGWGMISYGGAYGAQGLQQEEAMELIHLGGVVRGFLLNAPPSAQLEIRQWIEGEWKARGIGA